MNKEERTILIMIIVTAIILLSLIFGCYFYDKKYTCISSQFTTLEEWNEVSGLCYDNDTKIIYTYSKLEGEGYTYTPYYVLDTNDEPVVAIYNGDIADDEN